MAVEPQHENAVALAIDVHQQLLAQADNFWLNGWLENQIKLLKGGDTASLSLK